jgi:hypothetical protein
VKQPKSVQPVKAWALLMEGEIWASYKGVPFLFETEKLAKPYCSPDEKPIEVLITPISKKERKP